MKTKTIEGVEGVAPGQVQPIDGLRGEEWLLTQRVVASPGFARSALLTGFLLYVCDRKLRGREHEINEFEVGMRALGRPPSFHPGEDNIVRTYARMLRKRLDEYFETEGRHEPMRIVIPRGQYVPIFELNRHAEPGDPFPPPTTVETPETSRPLGNKKTWTEETQKSRGRRKWLISIGIGLSLFIAFGLAFLGYRSHRAAPPDVYGRFWTEVFDSNRSTYVVTGDSGFAMLEDMTGREIHLHDYVSGDIASKFPVGNASDPKNSSIFGADRYANYTSVADLTSVVELTRLPQFARGQVKIRYARDIRMNDLKQANVILFGGPHANPWVELFEPVSAFRMTFPSRLDGLHLDERSIVNKHPRAGEQTAYTNLISDDTHETYMILSWLPSMDGIGHALILEGENMAGTQAAADFVMNEIAMTPILKRAMQIDGSIGPFELLLETRTVGASAPEARPIVDRYGPRGSSQ